MGPGVEGASVGAASCVKVRTVTPLLAPLCAQATTLSRVGALSVAEVPDAPAKPRRGVGGQRRKGEKKKQLENGSSNVGKKVLVLR